MLDENQIHALGQLSSKLAIAKIDWLCIGGLAAIAWGAKRQLVDIDIQVSRQDVEKVRAIFRREVTIDLRRYLTDKWDIKQMIIEIDGIDIDICQAEDFYVLRESKRYLIPNCLGKATTRKVGDLLVPVLPKSELIKYKRLIARQVDKTDLEFLDK